MALKGKLNLLNLSSDPTTNLASGQVYYNTTDNVVKYYDGSAWVEMVAPSVATGSIPTSGLVFHLDAGDASSYSGSGSSWNDLSGNGYNFTVDQASFVSTGIKHFDFSTNYRAVYAPGGILTDVPLYSNATLIGFTRVTTNNSNWRTFTRGKSTDHQMLVRANANDLGMYDNNTGPSTFVDSQIDVTQINNYSTDFNGWFLRLSSSDPYWRLSINNSGSDIATITSSSPSDAATAAGATYDASFSTIGSHSAGGANPYYPGGQQWGDFAVFLYYDRHISYAEQASIYNYYKNTFGI